MFSLHLSPEAGQDLFENLSYIKDVLKNDTAAGNLLEEFQSALEKVRSNPEMFPLVKNEYLRQKKLRCVSIRNYMIFYVTDKTNSQIDVVRFLYGKRDWGNIVEL